MCNKTFIDYGGEYFRRKVNLKASVFICIHFNSTGTIQENENSFSFEEKRYVKKKSVSMQQVMFPDI